MTDTQKSNPNVSEDAADGGVANAGEFPNSIIEGEQMEGAVPPSTNDGGRDQGGPADESQQKGRTDTQAQQTSGESKKSNS